MMMRQLIRNVAMIALVLAFVLSFSSSQSVQAQGTYTVQPGDTLFGIAARFNVSVSELATINGIYDVNQVYVGQVLILPAPLSGGGGTTGGGNSGGNSGGGYTPVITTYPPGTTITITTTTTKYVVKQGDTLGSIAQKFRVTPDAIMVANGITNGNLIYVGQLLLIPKQTTTVKPPAKGSTGGTVGRIYIVQPGDTLDSIAAKFKRDRYAIAKANGLVNLNFIYAGQALIIP